MKIPVYAIAEQLSTADKELWYVTTNREYRKQSNFYISVIFEDKEGRYWAYEDIWDDTYGFENLPTDYNAVVDAIEYEVYEVVSLKYRPKKT